MSKRGLPVNFRLRHDEHYVEQLTSRMSGIAVGRMIPIDKLTPNPEQPRIDMGDLTELIASIREKGILEPILVRPSDVGGRYMIISGERRYRASLEAGLTDVPCIEMDVDDKGVAEISLIENLQRKDLNPFEEADGLRFLSERFGYTHEEIAKRIGKSRTSITETLSLAAMPEDVRAFCRRADMTSKSLLLQVVRQPTPREMLEFAKHIKGSHLTRDEARVARKSRVNRRTGFQYQYSAPKGAYTITVKFRKSEVSQDEVISALNNAIDNLR